ncbi:MAG TPA: protein kinase, partial [Hyphomonas sp.]|nr:protein kinase [Hyphomonas sp.]
PAAAAPKPAVPAAAPAAKAAAPKPAAPAADPVKLKTPEFKPEPVRKVSQHSEQYYATKTTVFNALIDTIDLSQLAQLDTESAREEIRDIVVEI